MCGRYSLFVPPEELADRFGVDVEGYEPTYNAAPGESLPVVTDEAPGELTHQEWGLVPSWADDADPHVNARAETVDEKPAFREAYERRRCLVPADGFYEWTDEDGGRRPYRVTTPEPFAMAGVYERWTPPTEQSGLDEFARGGATVEAREGFAVLTTEPNETVADLHHRMAVILDPDEEGAWLAGEDVPLDPYDGETRASPVSTAVNDPTNDSPALVREA